jgi:hypothetical protein
MFGGYKIFDKVDKKLMSLIQGKKEPKLEYKKQPSNTSKPNRERSLQ